MYEQLSSFFEYYQLYLMKKNYIFSGLYGSADVLQIKYKIVPFAF